MERPLEFETLAVRAGQDRSQFGEHSEAMYLTSSFVFESAAQAASRASGEEPGNFYSRFSNPTVTMLQQRLAALEGAEACIATASGMSAILATAMSLLKSGDHIVSSRSIFGATTQLFSTILGRFGIETSYVPADEVIAYRSAIKKNTRLIFVESPSNPLTEVVDISALSVMARELNIPLVVDNCFCTPALQQPLKLGADIVIHSATKYLDGQGRVMGGAVCCKQTHYEDLLKFLRTAGPTMSPFNAWVILKGMETLKIRMLAQSASALDLAGRLEAHSAIARVFYPGLPSHPQHALAMTQQKTGGAILSFEVKGGRSKAWRVIDNCRLLSITANLGDTKSTITHPASTTHGRVSPEARAVAGISEGLLRVAVGLESVEDIYADLLRGLR
jgi:O-succinylhomoserine sulfhydrylase